MFGLRAEPFCMAGVDPVHTKLIFRYFRSANASDHLEEPLHWMESHMMTQLMRAQLSSASLMRRNGFGVGMTQTPPITFKSWNFMVPDLARNPAVSQSMALHCRKRVYDRPDEILRAQLATSSLQRRGGIENCTSSLNSGGSLLGDAEINEGMETGISVKLSERHDKYAMNRGEIISS